MIVGRDTQKLNREGVAKAAVETVAENTSDGVIAPMLYMLIGGPALGWFYKAVNTMDSMIGYRNDRYLYFGRFAARMDDVLNFIPARLSALLMILSCRMARLDGKEAWRIFRRDRYNHASPNSAQTEAVMAGALHVHHLLYRSYRIQPDQADHTVLYVTLETENMQPEAGLLLRHHYFLIRKIT